MKSIVALAAIIALSTGAQQAQISGTGDTVTAPLQLKPGLFMLGAAHKGQRNFVLQLLGAEGDELVTNTIGDYQGVRLLEVAGGQYRVSVTADGPWVLMHEQPDPSAPATALPIQHQHTGDAPLGPFAMSRGSLIATFTHAGKRNFVVELFNATGRVGLVLNKIGSYSGTVSHRIDRAGPYWIAVRADGAWSMRLEM